MAGSPAGQPRWDARPVRLSAWREQTSKVVILQGAERASPAGGQVVRAPKSSSTLIFQTRGLADKTLRLRA
jgi:hypothetical protein